MKKQLLGALAGGALLAGVPSALAQQLPAVPADVQQAQAVEVELAPQDRQFAQKAAESTLAELELAKLARQEAETPEVKDYAVTLLEDHGLMADALETLADELPLELSPELPPEARQAAERLAGLRGGTFDRAYIDLMISAHEEAVLLYEDQQANGKNEALTEFAGRFLDTLRIHLDRARMIDREMGAEPPAGTAGGSPSASTEESVAGAQETPARQQPTDPLTQVPASELIGKTVVNQQGDQVGEVEDIVVSTSDQQLHAIVSVGGFLGIGDKSVALPFEELRQGQEEGHVLLTSGATEDELKRRPAYEEGTAGFERYPPDSAEGGL